MLIVLLLLTLGPVPQVWLEPVAKPRTGHYRLGYTSGFL